MPCCPRSRPPWPPTRTPSRPQRPSAVAPRALLVLFVAAASTLHRFPATAARDRGRRPAAIFGAAGGTAATAPAAAALIQLTTRSGVLPGRSAREVHDFLSTPANWPKIVLSSWYVEDVVTETGTNNGPRGDGGAFGRGKVMGRQREKDQQRRLGVGSSVDEIFGLPPLLPLRVRWTCVSADASSGSLNVRSPDGVPGLASDCRMLFEVRDVGGDGSSSKNIGGDGVGSKSRPSSDGPSTLGSEVSLRMEYEPRSPLARLALPVLAADNALALRVLLPWAMATTVTTDAASSSSPLNRFRRLMGTLYGVAGLAHLADCVAGPSRLLVAAGFDGGFPGLPPAGRALALAWCLAGPAAFVATRVGGPRVADLGIAGYGVVEVGCAWLVSSSAAAAGVVPEVDAVTNALVVQALVGTSWLYSSSRKESSE